MSAVTSVLDLELDGIGYRARELERRLFELEHTINTTARLDTDAVRGDMGAVEQALKQTGERIETFSAASKPDLLHVSTTIAEFEDRTRLVSRSVDDCRRAIQFAAEALLDNPGKSAAQAAAALLDARICSGVHGSAVRDAGHAVDLLQDAVTAAAGIEAGRQLHGSEAHAAHTLERACARAVASASSYRETAAAEAGAAKGSIRAMSDLLSALRDAADAAKARAAMTRLPAASDSGAAHELNAPQLALLASARADAAVERAERLLRRADTTGETTGARGGAGSESGSEAGLGTVHGSSQAMARADEATDAWERVRVSGSATEEAARRVLRARLA